MIAVLLINDYLLKVIKYSINDRLVFNAKSAPINKQKRPFINFTEMCIFFLIIITSEHA